MDKQTNALRRAADFNWGVLEGIAGPAAVTARCAIEAHQRNEEIARNAGDLEATSRHADAEEKAWVDLESLIAAKKAGRS